MYCYILVHGTYFSQLYPNYGEIKFQLVKFKVTNPFNPCDVEYLDLYIKEEEIDMNEVAC